MSCYVVSVDICDGPPSIDLILVIISFRYFYQQNSVNHMLFVLLVLFKASCVRHSFKLSREEKTSPNKIALDQFTSSLLLAEEQSIQEIIVRFQLKLFNVNKHGLVYIIN